MNNNKELGLFRLKLHNEVVESLKSIYGNEKWKYSFIHSVKEKFNVTVQYNQLSIFEEGGSRSENILNLMLMELLSHSNFIVSIKDKETNTSIKIKKEGAE